MRLEESHPGVLLLALSALIATTGRALDAQSIVDGDFAIDVIHEGEGTVPIAFGPEGRMYVGEKAGRILLFRRDPLDSTRYLPAVTFASLEASVEDSNERGLLGLTLHPDFETNRFIYAFYSYSGGQRLVRLTADSSYETVSDGPRVLLEGLPNNATNHNAGDIRFSPADGRLYITIGDDADSNRAQDLDVYHGKILRVDDEGLGLAGNPFFDGDVDSVRSRIWGLGCRNPFRFTFHPVTHVMYVSENGGGTDRVSRWGAAGANGGWPDEFGDPSDPEVRNVVTPPVAITGIAIVRGGPFADPGFPESDVVYVANWKANTISRWRLTGADLDGAVSVGGTTSFVSNLPDPSGLEVGPDGALYVTSAARTSGARRTLYRIRSVSGTPPTAAFSTDPDPPRGLAPLTVRFFDNSTDEGQIVSRRWQFGDGEESDLQEPSHTYDTPGVYTVSLTVADDDGLERTTSTDVTATREIDLNLSGTILDARSLNLAGLPAPTELRFYQVDAARALVVPGGVGPNANALEVAAGGTLALSGAVHLSGDGFIVSAGEPVDDGFQPARRGFVVPAGDAVFEETVTLLLSDTAVAGRITDTLENPANTDVGVSRGAPGNLLAVPGGRDFLAPIPPSGVAHRIESDELGFFYAPIPTSNGDAEFYFDVVGDTNLDIYLSATFRETVASGTLVEHDITLGLQAGGADCDSLPALSDGLVDYTQIQEIFDSLCVGCHGGVDPNAGLDLSAETSYPALVGAPSREVSGLNLVEPGDPGLSFLWEKVNCSLPQVGVRMPTGAPLGLQEQDLVHDWIAQGALQAIELAGDLLLEARFDAGEDLFVYTDDAFRGTDRPLSADGVRLDAGGFEGGALEVSLGGSDPYGPPGASGAWRGAFSLSRGGELAVFFRYRLSQSADYDLDEVSDVLAAVDGTLLGGQGRDRVARVAGDGSGGSLRTTGWRGFVGTAGVLDAGTHSLTVGAYNNEQSLPGATTRVLIDDVTLVLEEPSFRRSEANGDGKYDISDAIFILLFLFDPGFSRGFCRDALDSNDDGSVNVTDALFHVNTLFGRSLELPPPPFPDCGVDPTADTLDCEEPACP